VEGGGELRTICSSGDGIGFFAGGVGVFGKVGEYPTDFDVVEYDFAVATHEAPSDPQLDALFVPVHHRYDHLGTTPRPFATDGQQKL